MFHADNAYFVPHVQVDLAPLPDEHRLEHRLPRLRRAAGDDGDRARAGRDRPRASARTRWRSASGNLYGGTGRDVTPYGQRSSEASSPGWSTSWSGRRATRPGGRRSAAFNAGSPWLKRGIALTPVKFGISFTTTFLNQAGALVHVYTDGIVHLNHGGTEMGQGLNVKVAQVVADEFRDPAGACADHAPPPPTRCPTPRPPPPPPAATSTAWRRAGACAPSRRGWPSSRPSDWAAAPQTWCSRRGRVALGRRRAALRAS